MENMTYNVFHRAEWGGYVALYFYFTGLSAGTFVISAMATALGIEKYKYLAKYGALLAFLSLIAAPILLVADLGQPARFWSLITPSYFNVASALSWGSYLLVIYPTLCLAYAFLLWKRPEKSGMIKTLGAIGVPLALAVHGYTGFVFGVVKSRAFWHASLQPALFITSAFVSGLGLMILVVAFLNKYGSEKTAREIPKSLAIDLSRILAFALAVEMFLLFSQLLIMSRGNVESASAIKFALSSPMFVFGDIILGVVIPFVLLLTPAAKKSVRLVAPAAALALIGTLFARVSIVIIGQSIPIS